MKNRIAILVAASSLLLLVVGFFARTSNSNHAVSAQKADPDSTKAATKFKELLSGTGLAEDGETQYPFTMYATSDGGWVRYSTERQENAQMPAQLLEKRLSVAARVLEKKWIENDSGRELRAVASFSKPNYFAVLWTKGRYLRSIKSDSLEHATQFENWVLTTDNPPIQNPDQK